MSRRDAPAGARERSEDPRRRLRPSPELEDHGPEGDEHRLFPRARFAVRFEIRAGPEEAPRFSASLMSENLSVSGAFLASTFFLPLGTELFVRFQLQETTREEISARAEVVREERPDRSGEGRSGFGIRFLEFDAQSEVGLARVFLSARIRSFVESYLKTRRAKGLGSEIERVIDALAAWELLQVTEPTDPWRPQGLPET